MLESYSLDDQPKNKLVAHHEERIPNAFSQDNWFGPNRIHDGAVSANLSPGDDEKDRKENSTYVQSFTVGFLSFSGIL